MNGATRGEARCPMCRRPLPPAPTAMRGARATIERARQARFLQDSTLTSYDATVKQRLSAGLNVKAIGRDRLLFRMELAATRPMEPVARCCSTMPAGQAHATSGAKSTGNVRGADVGVSFLDGLARIDLARGLDPHTVWRMHLYVEATF